MGTRADFYLGTDQTATYLGSLNNDGSPDALPKVLSLVECENEFLLAVDEILSAVDYSASEWPWAWEDSRLTDYVYCWDGSKVVVTGLFHYPEDIDFGGFEVVPFNLPRMGTGNFIDEYIKSMEVLLNA